MVIRASSGREVDALLADLAADSAVRRDGAVARLTVIGARAVQRLVTLATNTAAAAATRSAAFRALEAIADSRSLDAAIETVTDANQGVAAAAVGVVGVFLQSERGVVALDRLTALALDRSRQTEVRVAAMRAIATLGPSTVEPVIAALPADLDPEVTEALVTALGRSQVTSDPMRCLDEAAAGKLPDEPELLGQSLVRASARTPLTTLQRVVEQIRAREGSEGSPRRSEWMRVRATAHAALAGRGSRLALYDLRETIEAAQEPLAVEFLAALSSIGDESCLEPIATAYATGMADRVPDDWWRRSLLDAFHAIAEREGVTRRRAVARRIAKRWPGIIDPLFEGSTKATSRGDAASTRRR